MSVNNITPDQILAQMRQLQAAAQAQTTNAAQPAANNNESFTNALSQAINTVSQYQQASSAAANQIESGDGGVSLVKAMIAAQKSSVAFEAAVQVRNRVVSAYQDIMNMPI